MLKKLLLPSLYIVDHRELNASVVDLLQADYHPEEVREHSAQLSIIQPFFEFFTAIVNTFQPTKVYSDYLMLKLFIHLLSNFEDIAILSCPFIKEIS
jgi:hypothetical protein